MGYDNLRFTTKISEELLCGICGEVLENAVTTDCEHLFCKQCLLEWLSVNMSCPIDRIYISSYKLKAAPRVVRNLLAKLEIRCKYESDGCQTVVSLEKLRKHVDDCYFNTKNWFFCEKGCKEWLNIEELKTHNCWRDLKEEMLRQQQINVDLKRQRNGLIFVIVLLSFYITYPIILFCFNNF